MLKLSAEEMIKGNTSNYPLVVAVAKRAREITDDIVLNSKVVVEKPVELAFEDIKSGKYEIFDPEA